MTREEKRVAFAAAALQGLLAYPGDGGTGFIGICEAAWKYANMMLDADPGDDDPDPEEDS